VRYAITIGGAGGEQDTETFTPFPVGTETHFAISVDADFGITTLYLNGTAAAIEFGVPITPSFFFQPTAAAQQLPGKVAVQRSVLHGFDR
jgi:hypothetical protein